MRILFVADGRSPTTRSWLRNWTEEGHTVHLVSTFPCDAVVGVVSQHILPVAFNRMAGGNPGAERNRSRAKIPLRGLLMRLRYWLGPLSLGCYTAKFRRLVEDIQPDLVHALRIPFEGMLASALPQGYPLVLSIWGNDITLHAHGSILMKALTRRALIRAQGLMADTSRDIRLGQDLGFSGQTLVVPGSGGIRLDEIQAVRKEPLPMSLPEGKLVVNPRGQRPGSLRQDVFFHAAALVLKQAPHVNFVCPPLAGDADANRWLDELNIRTNTHLLPALTQAQLWSLYRKACIYVSPSIHDGTPNSLLEAMACGCFPVVGDIDSHA